MNKINLKSKNNKRRLIGTKVVNEIQFKIGK